jgi:hypothetical protein
MASFLGLGLVDPFLLSGMRVFMCVYGRFVVRYRREVKSASRMAQDTNLNLSPT